MTSMPPPWDPDEGETDETRVLPREGETHVLPPSREEPTRVREDRLREDVVREEPRGPGPPPGAAPAPDRGLWPWLLLLLAIVVVGLAVLWWFTRDDGGSGQPGLKPVADVVGLQVEEARTRLTDEGFVVAVVRRPSDEAAKDVVVAQQPPGGTEAADGSTVGLTVSAGPATTTVPSVVGLPQAQATARLEDAGLKATAATVPSSEPEGVVVAQSPKAGEDAERGSNVRINVSGGPGTVAVPDVTGSALDDAVAALEQAGLAAAPTEVDSGEPAGTVVDQDPAAGAEVRRGSTVALSVSRGPQATAVPDVTGLAQEDATTQLEDAGFRVRVVEEAAPDPAQVGTVLRQVPPAGREAPPNAQVTIVVGV